MPELRNPVGIDPTRTTLLRRQFSAEVSRRFGLLKGDLKELILKDNAMGLITNQEDWSYMTPEERLEQFRRWLKRRLDFRILAGSDAGAWWEEYIRRGHEKGMDRAFADLQRYGKGNVRGSKETREQFLRSSFLRPVAVERVKMLVSRAKYDLEGISAATEQQITRELVDGMIRGDSPREVAKLITERVDKVGVTRALQLARSETIRAHAEGQLDMLESMGVEEVGVQVEFSTAGDGRVCPQCRALNNKVYKIADARGLIPVHNLCRCAFIPAVAKRRLIKNYERLVINAGSNCGANSPGGGGFQKGNTCAKGKGGIRRSSTEGGTQAMNFGRLLRAAAVVAGTSAVAAGAYFTYRRMRGSVPIMRPNTYNEFYSSIGDNGKTYSSEIHTKTKIAISNSLKEVRARWGNEVADKYEAAAHKALDHMSPKAVELFGKNVSLIKWFDTETSLAKFVSEKFMFGLPTDGVAGAYVYRAEGSWLLLGGSEHSARRLAEVFSHEFYHAVDSGLGGFGKGGVMSGSSEAWVGVWQSEIANGRLTKYATTSPEEGWAEFGRVITMHNHSVVKQRFPQSYKHFQSAGLLDRD